MTNTTIWQTVALFLGRTQGSARNFLDLLKESLTTASQIQHQDFINMLSTNPSNIHHIFTDKLIAFSHILSKFRRTVIKHFIKISSTFPPSSVTTLHQIFVEVPSKFHRCVQIVNFLVVDCQGFDTEACTDGNILGDNAEQVHARLEIP